MPKDLSIEEILTSLRDAPERMAASVEGVGPDVVHARPSPDEWSASEILAHIRSCCDVWGGTIARIIDEDEPTIRAISPRTWIHRTDYPALEFGPSFSAFATQRVGLLSTLDSLAPEAWARTANITGAGGRLVWTVKSCAERLARHERAHVKQLEGVVKALR